jgi:predicted ferric reductase
MGKGEFILELVGKILGFIKRDIITTLLVTSGIGLIIPSFREILIIHFLNLILIKLSLSPIAIFDVSPWFGLLLILLGLFHKFILFKNGSLINKTYNGISGNKFKNKGNVNINYNKDNEE